MIAVGASNAVQHVHVEVGELVTAADASVPIVIGGGFLTVSSFWIGSLVLIVPDPPHA
jgi:hypothetical protein